MSIWDPDQLWLKAKAYAERANQVSHENPDFPFWSALSLELLARSALTRMHPVLNADPRQDVNILYGCGFSVAGQPKSLPAHSVFLRLEKTVPGFSTAQREVCEVLSLLRNQELHTAELPFSSFPESKWLSRYYETCKILCEFQGKTLEEFFGADIAVTAVQLIDALARATESTVRQRIADHAKAFAGKKASERDQLVAEANIALLWHNPDSKKQVCPACGTEGILTGTLIKELPPEYIDERLLINQEYLATRFECPACKLTLRTVEEISVAGMEPRFARTRESDLHELYESELGYDYDNM